MPIRSGMTRWSIWPSVSRVFDPRRGPARSDAAAFGELHPLAQLERVVVGDDDLGPLDVVQHVRRNQLAAGVVAVGVVRLEDTEPVLDGESRRDDQKAAREVACCRDGERR